MDDGQILTMVITAAFTGAMSTFTTVIALKVHINYLREGLQRQELAIARAHERIDELDL